MIRQERVSIAVVPCVVAMASVATTANKTSIAGANAPSASTTNAWYRAVASATVRATATTRYAHIAAVQSW